MPANLLRPILLSLAALPLLAFPSAADGDPLANLIGTSWKLTALNGAAVSPDLQTTLNVSDNGIGGNGGCNTYGGELATTPTGIDISQVFSTMMACDNLSQEQAYFAALEATDAFALVGGKLQFLENGAVRAEFAPAG